MRRAARTDSNQAAIVAALRKAGCSVQSLAAVGKGCPDLLVGRAGRNYLIEVKDGSLSPSERRLTTFEHKWISEWDGQVNVAMSVTEAMWIVGLTPAFRPSP